MPSLSEAEIAALYQKYGHALYKRCLRLIGNREDARELVQECFCQFYAGRERFKGESSPFTFLYRIATNLSIDRLRRRTTAGVKIALEDAPALSQGGRTQAEQVQTLQELAMLTEGMDDETLTIAVMSHVDGMSQEEIAEALDLSRKTIGKKLARFTEVAQSRAGVKA
jgi:RNA polymerase sigma-70 factor (ECF subfamily)